MQILQNEKRTAQLILLNANLIWGVTPIFLEVVLLYITPLQATTLRFGIAALTLSLILYLSRGSKAFSLLSSKTIIILGWLDAFGYLAVTVGQNITTAGLATLVSSFYVFIVPFLAWKLEGAQISFKLVIVGLLSLLGIFLISFNGDWSNFRSSSILGIAALMFSAIMWGFYTVITSRFLTRSEEKEKKIDLLSFTNSSLLHTTIALSIISLLAAEPISTRSIPLLTELIPFIIFLGIFPTIIALSSWNWAVTRLGSINTSFYQLTQIIIPFALEFVLFQQFYTAWIYGGILLILTSTLLITEKDSSIVPTSLSKNTPDDSLVVDTSKHSIICCS